MRRYQLEIVVFLTGAIIMILELVGMRLLGPFLGSSIIVWSALICLILAGLSLGAFWGGKIADKDLAQQSILSSIVLGAALCIALLTIVADSLVNKLAHVSDLRLASLLAALLFVPASFLLGAIGPFATRLRLKEVASSGSTLGRLSALSSLGSIFGTILAGFLLLTLLGTKLVLATLVIVLMLMALSLSPAPILNSTRSNYFLWPITSLMLVLIFIRNSDRTYYETLYSRVWITNEIDRNSQRPIRSLKFDPLSTQSAMFTDQPTNIDPFMRLQANFGRLQSELAVPYTRFFDLGQHFNPHISRILILGGAGFSYPSYCLKHFPNANIDVVEIDAGLTQLAKRFFNLKDNTRLKIIHQDGRVFLNSSNNIYDMIVLDVFNSGFSIPFQLSTKEALQQVSRLLNAKGVVVINIISAVEGKAAQLYQSEVATLNSVFPQVFTFPVADPLNTRKLQNQILIALKDQEPASLHSKDTELANYLGRVWPKSLVKSTQILTDDFAPVEYYSAAAVALAASK